MLSLDPSWKTRRYMQRLEGFMITCSFGWTYRVDIAMLQRPRFALVSRLRILTLRALGERYAAVITFQIVVK